MKRRLFFAAMVLVTAWSLWAVAQTKKPAAPPHPSAHATPTHAASVHPVVRAAPTASAIAPAAAAVLAAHPTINPASPHAASAEEKSARDEKKGEEAEEEAPRPVNWTDFGTETPPYLAMAINFAILVCGYYLFGKRPIASALTARRDSIAKEIEQATRIKEEAEARAQMYSAKLAQLQEEAVTAREALVRAGEAERDRIVADAEAKAERMRKDAEFLAIQEFKQVRQDLMRETVEAAVHAAEDLLVKRVTQADQERLAEDYLADLAGRKGGPGAAGLAARKGGEELS